MDYHTFEPDAPLKPFLKSFWIASGADLTPQKVVCDGHSELIFHFGSPYQIQKNGKWLKQSPSLVAGQIDKPILLRPDGISGVLGMTFNPTGLWRLFGWDMRLIQNEVVSLREFCVSNIGHFEHALAQVESNSERIRVSTEFLLGRLASSQPTTVVDDMVAAIYAGEGCISVSTLAKDFDISMRTMERHFNIQVGLPPKTFSRIIRFKRVYQLLQQTQLNTAEVSYLCGYFDQPHLDKDFKSFSGEDPKKYFSGNHPFAAFLLTRK